MEYKLSKKYDSLMHKIMGPNPIKLCEELLSDSKIKPNSIVCDLGSGQGLTSIFMAKEYGYKVYAADLWSNPDENRLFFEQQGIRNDEVIPVKADAENMPFKENFFDALVSIDSYNYFGRDEYVLDNKILPYIKSGGYIYIAIPGMKKDCHTNLPPELLLSWTPEQLDYMHDISYWRSIVSKSSLSELINIYEMQSNDEVWADWLMQDNEYAVGDRKSMEAGAGKYLNFIAIVLRKK